MGILIAMPGKVLISNGKPFSAAGAAAGGGLAATALTVNNLASDWIYQNINGFKAVPISGTTNGTRAVEVRLVDAYNSANVTAWQTLDAAPAGGVFAGSLMVPAGRTWWIPQVRDGAVVAVGTKYIGVGERFGLIGQSNMVNLWANVVAYLTSSKFSRQFISGAFTRVGTYNDAYPDGTPYSSTNGLGGSGAGGKGEGIIEFVNKSVAALNCLVATFEYAVSGSALASWVPGGANWNTFIAAVQAADGDIGNIIYYQGEESASSGVSAAAHEAGLVSILNGIKTQTNRNAENLKFGVVTLGPTVSYGPEGSFGRIRGAALSFLNNNAGTYLAGVAGDGTVPAGDPVHLVLASQIHMGRRYAHTRATGRSGPKIVGATRSGLTVTVATSGATGVLKDGAGGSGAGLLGFRFFDAGAAGASIGYTASALSGANIVLTLSSAPVGALTMDHGMANLPYGSVAPATGAIVYDSDVVPGETVGLPLQPLAAIAVT